MILSATFSKPTASVTEALGAPYVRIKSKLLTASKAALSGTSYALELFTQTQAFHKKMTQSEFDAFVESHAGKTFRSCVLRTETEEITILGNKHGKITRLTKPLSAPAASAQNAASKAALQKGGRPASEAKLEPFSAGAKLNRTKNYLLAEGTPVPFLVHLGIMTAEGKVISAKYDKFRQINRFLEYIDDILPDVLALKNAEAEPLTVVDFGCGKSYLTFAVQYFLTEVRHLPCEVTGLDLKADVIAYCNQLVSQFGCKNLHFAVGDIASYQSSSAPDLVITLHACDTATDYALHYAVRRGARAILSVPCCQHELNTQLRATSAHDSPLAPLLKHGILKERFAALATDALRASLVEASGYKVQMLEFIDMSHTPKNLLLRAVLRKNAAGQSAAEKKQQEALAEAQALISALGITHTLDTLLKKP